MIPHNGYFKQLIDSPRVETFFSTRHVGLDAVLADQKIPPKDVVHMHQVHEANVAIVSSAPSEPIPNTDAVVTHIPGVVLAVKTADCLPLLILHNTQPIIAAIHAGRKSTQSSIVLATIKTIQNTFHCGDDFTFWFGPSICKACYQIDQETDLHFDLIGENESQIASVINAPTIIKSNRCTKCENDVFFSYRGGDRLSRLYSLIRLKPE